MSPAIRSPLRSARRALPALLALLAACAAPSVARVAPGTTETQPMPAFATAPADVLVAPVRDTSGAYDSPREPLRRALYAGLVGRLFSPVQLAFVDRRIPEGRSEPALHGQDEALLRTHVTRWDASELESRGVVHAEVHAELVRLSGEAELLLWRTFLSRTLELDTAQVRRAAQADLVRLLAERLAADVLAELPARGSLPPAPEAAAPTPAGPAPVPGAGHGAGSR